MNPLVKKEIRLLLPAWIAAMLLAVLPLSISAWTGWVTGAPAIGVPLAFVVGFLLLGIQSFGQEINSGTFAALLSQPMERRQIWRVKMSVLAFAFVSILFVWAFPREIHFVGRLYANSPPYADFPFALEDHFILFVVTIFSGALWTTLLLRQVVAALWLTLLVPLALVYLISLGADIFKWSDGATGTLTAAVLMLYSTGGFFFARRLFLNAQDTQWTGGTFILWRGRHAKQTALSVERPARNHLMALFWKEIQLQDANLFIGAIVLVLNIAALGLRSVITNGNIKAILEFVWALWLLMPLLIGCSAVAEERRLGVAEGQLCQPVSRRIELCIKFFVTLGLSFVLGAVAPSLIEWTPNFGITDWRNFWIFFTAPAIFFISFYASTLSRSTVHAIGAAIAVSAAGLFGFLICAAVAFHTEVGPMGFHYRINEDLCRVYLMKDLSFLIFTLVLASLMFWNFKWLHTGWRLFWRNAATIAVTFGIIVVLTNLIYFRTWELLLPAETAHGTVRLTLQSQVKISFHKSFGHDTITALLPDGRLWQQGIDFRPLQFPAFSLRCDPDLESHRFIGSNWSNVAGDEYHLVGIQQNGSLWRIPRVGSKAPMVRISSDTNWWKVAGFREGFLLLKKDGTLWVWGTNQTNEIDEKVRLDLKMPPARIDAGSDWTNVISFDYIALAQKTDGSYWGWRRKYSRNGQSVSQLIREENLDSRWGSYGYWFTHFVEVKTNGQLWADSRIDPKWLHSLLLHGGDWLEAGIPRYAKTVQLGSDSGWKSVSFGSDSLILLRKDGTLWKWTQPWYSAFHPVRLGHYSDWVALDPGLGVALAADGSLWLWDDPSSHLLLAPSRKPVYMGNIFQGSENEVPPTAHIEAYENSD